MEYITEEYIVENSMPVTESGCWLWMKGVTGRGYGSIYLHGAFKRYNEYISAHRAAYIAFKGPIPKGSYILHKCDVSLCVNPEHLYAGTQRDNIRDQRRRSKRKEGTGYGY